MGEKKLPLYLTVKQLREEVVDWTDEILRKRIDKGFPAFKDDGGRYLFPRDEVLDYMKRRRGKSTNV